MNKSIIIQGARQNNLKNINLKLPRNRLVVITGLSGSGKSSLAFDTVYAEGQRRYIESLSAYARQFLGQMSKPELDYIEGLSPAIAIEQRTAATNPRSTVATATEIHDYLRLLYSRVGIPHCYKCGRRIERQTVDQIVDKIMRLPRKTPVTILSPVIRGKKGEYRDYLKNFYKKGFLKAQVDGKPVETDKPISLQKYRKHSIDIIIDQLPVTVDEKDRLAESVQTALSLAGGIITVQIKDRTEVYSEQLSCPYCGVSIDELTPRSFSFNSPYGACKECTGLGVKIHMDPDLVIPEKDKTLNQGAIAPFAGSAVQGWILSRFRSIAYEYGFNFNTPVNSLSRRQLNILLYGSGEESPYRRWEGIINLLERRYHETTSESMKEWYQRFMSIIPCASCKGDRLRPESLSVKVADKSIAEVTRMSITAAAGFFNTLQLDAQQTQIAQRILKEIRERLSFLSNVGLGYLTLDRTTGTLSGGEAQRIQLATQIGSSLTGVLYVLDEPTIGLHQRDNRRLIEILKKLRDLGNTVLVVEHDEEMIKSSDYIVDLGPGAGREGGYVVATGTPEQIMKCRKSLTGKYLSHLESIHVPELRRRGNGKNLTVKGCRENNLKNIDVEIPLGTFVCITGVSGSGKSTFLNDILYRALAQKFYRAKDKPGKYSSLEGVHNIDKVIIIDQSPIGRTPRSNPATYIGAFTYIRELYSMLPESRMRGYKPGRFSFNVKGGRCEACEGAGIIKIEMYFLPDVYVPCQVCKGKRYGRETLEIHYKDKSISDVLNMTVDEALEFFKNIPRVYNKLKTVADVGLGYITLGQSATTLSGGEAQRVKLSTELSRRSTGKTSYILDEPTTGLHFADVKKLLNVLQRLVDAGNTVLVIEHNMEIIKTADHLIDLGPGGGEDGGYIVAEGTPEFVATSPKSYTGRYLRKIIQQDLIEKGEWSKAQQLV